MMRLTQPVVPLITLFALSACPDDDAANFRGSYQTSITLSGNGSSTYPDSMTISDGDTSDLIIQSRQLGAIKADLLGSNALTIEQQQITLTNSSGSVFAVTIQGQGTVNAGVFQANGTLTGSGGVLSYTISGSRL